MSISRRDWGSLSSLRKAIKMNFWQYRVPRKKLWIVVPYKELSKKDGFVLTAYFTSSLTWLLKKEVVWNRAS